ncbi:MAG: 3-methyladenine DNA glycosylase [Mycobacterium sp.]
MADAVLDEADWTARERAHRDRVDRFLEPHLRRAQAGAAHPVWDFLFRYYSLRPRQLRVWHPGFGVTLAGDAARRYLGRSGYGSDGAGVAVTDEHLRARVGTVRFIAGLLSATAERQPQLNCFGLHEWAMVYRSPTVRHDRVPLRLGPAATDAVVESMPLRCSHFDAFRFFTDSARPKNVTQLTRAEQVAEEQPGCLHAAMDLYKWSYKLGPLIESGLLLECLDVAADARELDMRASPYDLTAHGFTPITIEEPAGRAEYVRCQRVISERAAPLRQALKARCDLLLAASV